MLCSAPLRSQAPCISGHRSQRRRRSHLQRTRSRRHRFDDLLLDLAPPWGTGCRRLLRRVGSVHGVTSIASTGMLAVEIREGQPRELRLGHGSGDQTSGCGCDDVSLSRVTGSQFTVWHFAHARALSAQIARRTRLGGRKKKKLQLLPLLSISSFVRIRVWPQPSLIDDDVGGLSRPKKNAHGKPERLFRSGSTDSRTSSTCY